ncbi:ankyrin repeat domain-containing protein 16-like [Rhipicephalus sanguineus]|uniref:ankyrin repeat domain-containing protein 16-like n=1 Tax=Rhipicephalus sanguineus TaxID=34632 RepID=UPI0020C2CE94|nr:ankyrin repeat domain-containing protein 16-like [Rhipicephalus sanguineus]
MSCLLDISPDAWNTSSRNKRTPLHTAALHGQLQCVKLLLKRGHYPPDVADTVALHLSWMLRVQIRWPYWTAWQSSKSI